MRGNAAEHQFVAPGSLSSVLELMASEPGAWTPIAGGTELMVAFSTGRLTQKKLVSLWEVSELRFIDTNPYSIIIGAGTTFLDLRNNEIVSAELQLLAKASSWIGSIANQTRATLGGNLVNGSPAADSSPALLVYDADVELVSMRGRRIIPYSQFHTGYKSNAMNSDELLYAVHIPRRFERHRQYLRKVGTRRAMAISKIALGATALVRNNTVEEIRLAAASLAPFPLRLVKTEAAIQGMPLTPETLVGARRELIAEAQPIDDIRSTSDYRRQVAANLLDEFIFDMVRGSTRT